MLPTEPGQEQFALKVWEGDEVIDSRPIPDPFIHTTIRPRGLRLAWAVLHGRVEWRVVVTGTPEAHRAVFTADYSPQPEEGASRVLGPPTPPPWRGPRPVG